LILPLRCYRCVYIGLLAVQLAVPAARAQSRPEAGTGLGDPYSARRTWSAFSEYSPTSSHIILGTAREREFATLGFAFTRRMREGHYWDLSYLGEIRPLMADSDPVETGLDYNIQIPSVNGVPGINAWGHYRLPHECPLLARGPAVTNQQGVIDGLPYSVDYAFHYGRRWTYVGGMSPLGLQANVFKRRRAQLLLMANGGFAAAPRDIPLFHTSAGNFTFEFGAGFELLPRRGRSLRLEYRIQHFSNAHVGFDPGIDSQMLHVGYVFSR
jgi:hypothetical protein